MPRGRIKAQEPDWNLKADMISIFWKLHGVENKHLVIFLQKRCGQRWTQDHIDERYRTLCDHHIQVGGNKCFAEPKSRGYVLIADRVVEWVREQRSGGTINDADYREATVFELGDGLVEELDNAAMSNNQIGRLKQVEVTAAMVTTTSTGSQSHLGFTVKSDIMIIFWSSRAVALPVLVSILETRCDKRWSVDQIMRRKSHLLWVQRATRGEDQAFRKVDEIEHWNYDVVDDWIWQQVERSNMSKSEFESATRLLGANDALSISLGDDYEGLDIDRMCNYSVTTGIDRAPWYKNSLADRGFIPFGY